ncbi:MAG TPA: ligase-associated DNA damage response DEXH box helicase [Thermoanaerobaculia bacterium]|nr:ligase-associated DNA damage response DEXH box helicase [Thermoanaerobaculia bacterium]
MTVESWFAGRGWRPFPFQREVWEAYAAGESGLVHAATGTGKTYAVWFAALQEALAEGAGGRSAPPLRVLWLTPLRALAADTVAALQAPLSDLGLRWSLGLRTGDTSSAVRSRQKNRLPTALVTTPESVSVLLSQPEARELFSGLRLVVVDEWHELLGSKRGVQAELALARLRGWNPALRTWGLSATLGNLETALAALVGVDGAISAKLVQGAASKVVTVDSLLPEEVERFPWAGHLGLRLLPQVIAAVEEAQSALVFTNTRAQAEIWFQAILEARPDWAGVLTLHHGSLDRKVRDFVEEGLRRGDLRCVVCTSSLDLGVDFAPVDRVVQVGSPKGVARLLQRAGRSGHRPGAASRVTCAPTHAFELVEVAAARRALIAGRLEPREPPDKPLDVLAQHLVTVALGGGFAGPELLAEVRTSHAFRGLTEAEWEWTLDFVTRGGPALAAYPEYRRVENKNGVYVVPDAMTARRHRLAIGTIASDAAVAVQYVSGGRLGSVEEAFVARLRPGDRFVFAGKVLELQAVQDMTAYVRRARGKGGGAIPRWMGGRMPLSTELAGAVREELERAGRGVYEGPEMAAVRPILELQARWSALPEADELLIERLASREGHHLFFYPFEGRLVHEGLAALCAYRLSRLAPLTFTLAVNDYGFELLCPDPPPLDEALAGGLLSPGNLLEDVAASLNAIEMAKRQFREIARVAGLLFTGFPGQRKPARHLQASSGLFYEVFAKYDPGNLLLHQAHREVLERQLEASRLGQALTRLAGARLRRVELARPSPLGFPLMVERMREKLSSEKLADRVRRMQAQLERAAGRSEGAEGAEGADRPSRGARRKPAAGESGGGRVRRAG